MLKLERISKSTDVFQKNISELRLRQPALADRLVAVDLPDSLQCATGRDGYPVIVESITDDCVGWMGGSSMPSVSAPAVLAKFVDQGVNVALPSIGTGYEWSYLRELLQPHCAVFVCEESTARLAAALCVLGMYREIAEGYLILLDGDVEKSMPEFIDEQPGYDFPTQLLPLPEFDAARFKSRTDAIHRACQRASERHARHLNRLREHVKIKRRSSDNPPHIAIVSVDASPNALEHADKVKRAARVLGWTSSISVPDRPNSCSLASRLGAIAAEPVDLVVVINGTPGRLAEFLPKDFPVACWFLDDSRLPPVAFEGVSELTHLVAASLEVQQSLIAHGGRTDRIQVVEKGVDHFVYSPERRSPGRSDSILVMVDGEDLDPKAANIGLESHEKLWQEMQRSIAQASDRKKSMNLPDLLAKAERSTGVKLSNEDLRQQFLAVVAERLPKTVVTRSVVEAMIAGGFSVSLFGERWDMHNSVSSSWCRERPSDMSRGHFLAGRYCAVIPFIDAAAVECCLEAIAAGCLPVMREDYADYMRHYPEASRVLSKVPSFGTHTELLSRLRKWNSESKQRNELVDSLRTELLSDQRHIDSLQKIHNWVCPQSV